MYKKMSTDRRLSEQVADFIRLLIRNAHLKPGDKIPSELELGRLFGVSRPTIRQAVSALVTQNVLSIQRGRGTFVTETPGLSDDPFGLDLALPTNQRLALIEARLAIEPGVARLAAENRTDEDVEKIDTCLKNMDTVVRDHRFSMTIELEFHRGIAEATRNPIIIRIVPIILDSILKAYADYNPTADDHGIAFPEHIAIFEAIRDRDADGAQLAMQRHVENSYRRSIRRYSEKAGAEVPGPSSDGEA